MLNDNASDPSGVCALSSSLTGPENVYSGAEGNQNPGTIWVGGEIGAEFEYGLDPCWAGDTDYGSWTIPGGIADGTYNANVYAANAGNYEAQGFSGNGSPTIASYSNSISVDDTQPSLSVSPTGVGNTGTVSITVGPSGLGSVSCTQGGASVTLTPEGGNPGGGAGTYNYGFATNTSGVACEASNGDVNGALTGTVNVPTIQIDPSGYTQGSWTSQPVTIEPSVTAVGGDGTTDLSCTVNGNPAGTPSSFVVSADGVDTIECTVEDATYTSNVGSATLTVDEDSQVPKLSFDTGGGYAPTSSQATDPSSAPGQNWLNGTDPVTIGVTGTEATVLSGVSQMTCVANGYSSHPFTLTNTGSTPFDDSFTLTATNGGIDGQNVIVCSGASGASVTGADGATVGSSSSEYVDVSDDSWPSTPDGHESGPPATCGISGAVDRGKCAYSDGPSQTVWQRTPQTVRITADHTQGGAPITSITCSGVTMPVSSWTAAADPQDVDSDNGMSVVATVEPQGGTLSCSATDSATPADTYDLGTYYFPIDSIAPDGWFEPVGYNGAPKDVIQVEASDVGSGVAQVIVQATDTTTGQLYAGSALTGDPADGTSAYATYNPGSHLYDVTVDPALLPANDSFAFTATVSDVAGNTATISTIDPADGGGQFVLTPGGSGANAIGDLTDITAMANAVRPALAAKTAKQEVTTTTLPELPSFMTGASSTASTRSHMARRSLGLVSALAKTKAKVCTKAEKVKVRVREHLAKDDTKTVVKTEIKRVRIKCPSTATVHVVALSVPYGKAITITGTLADLSTPSVVMGGDTITVYETDQATGVTTIAGQTTTSRTGAFSYPVKAGASRQITLAYAGSANQRGTSAAFLARYIGKTTVHAKTKLVTAGKTITLSGRLLGGDVPDRGAIVQVFYILPGHTFGWAPFKRAQTNRKGIYVVKLPTVEADVGDTYKLRVEIPAQTAWGFQKTTSNVVTVQVSSRTQQQLPDKGGKAGSKG